MARNKFEIRFLKFKHFYATSQEVQDIVVLDKLRDYIENYIKDLDNNIIDSKTYPDGGFKSYFFEFQKQISVNKVNDLLEEIFKEEQWIISQIQHNPSMELYVVNTL